MGGAAVWATPVVQSLTAPAWAAGSPVAECGRFTGGGDVNRATPAEAHFGYQLYCSPEVAPQHLTVTFLGCFNHRQDPRRLTFHLDQDAITSEVCSLEGDPTPPRAPINRIDLSAGGWITPANATSPDLPATVEATILDNGEPGYIDRVSFTITYVCRGASDPTVFSTSGTGENLDGNNQAHRVTGSRSC